MDQNISVTKISAGGIKRPFWKLILDNRELLYYFVWRNFKVRYKQTVLGASWAIFRPFILMVVFTLAFNRVGNIPSGAEHLPYPVFSYAGLIFWTYFSQASLQVADSLLAFQTVIQKIYFPRILVPISIAIAVMMDFFFSLIVYVGLLFYYQIFPSMVGILLFFPMLLLTVVTVLGIGLFFSALNVKYRDVGQAFPFAIQVLMFLTPVIYPVDLVPSQYQWVLFLNPITGVIDTIRSTSFGVGDVNPYYILISIASSIALFILGFLYFKRKEQEFADII